MEIIFCLTIILQWNKPSQIWKHFPKNILQQNKRNLHEKLKHNSVFTFNTNKIIKNLKSLNLKPIPPPAQRPPTNKHNTLYDSDEDWGRFGPFYGVQQISS